MYCLARYRPFLVLVLILLTGAGTPRTRTLRQTQSAATLAPAVSRHALRALLSRGASGTYIDEMLLRNDSVIVRWPERRGTPLRVWVQPSVDVSGGRPDLVPRVHAAFREWEALDIPVRFVFVSDSASAEVRVGWTDHFLMPISGKTMWSRDDDWWIVDASITIAVHHSGGAILDGPAIRAIALHEVGHLLGLDHAADSTSIMASLVRARELSPADSATMRLLYELPAGPVR